MHGMRTTIACKRNAASRSRFTMLNPHAVARLDEEQPSERADMPYASGSLSRTMAWARSSTGRSTMRPST